MDDDSIDWTVSCGNVFQDLGLSNPEELRLKSDLIIEITNILKEKGMPRQTASEILGSSDELLENLLRGKGISRVTFEQLLSWVKKLGYILEVKCLQNEKYVPEPKSMAQDSILEESS